MMHFGRSTDYYNNKALCGALNKPSTYKFHLVSCPECLRVLAKQRSEKIERELRQLQRLKDHMHMVVNTTVDCPKEYLEVLNDNFWDILA